MAVAQVITVAKSSVTVAVLINASGSGVCKNGSWNGLIGDMDHTRF